MSFQPSLLSFLVWLAVGHLISPRIVASGDLLYDPNNNGIPVMSDVGNCITTPINNCAFAATAAGLAKSYAGNPAYFSNLIRQINNDYAVVTLHDWMQYNITPYNGVDYTIAVTVSITNTIQVGMQTPLARNPSAVWPTVLQNALLLVPQQVPGSYLAKFDEGFDDGQGVYAGNVLLTYNQRNSISLSPTDVTDELFSEYWQLINLTFCTSSFATSFDTIVWNERLLIPHSCSPSNCDFTQPSPSVTLYDPMFDGNARPIYIGDGYSTEIDAQGFITMPYATWVLETGNIECSAMCPALTGAANSYSGSAYQQCTFPTD